jgi:hypothetical protein
VRYVTNSFIKSGLIIGISNFPSATFHAHATTIQLILHVKIGQEGSEQLMQQQEHQLEHQGMVQMIQQYPCESTEEVYQSQCHATNSKLA